MKKRNGQLIFAPSDLIDFMESKFITWMERYNLEFPGKVQPDEVDESLEILQKKGIEHESEFLEQLKKEDKSVAEIPRNDTSIRDTRSAIFEGKEIIYQAHLERAKDSIQFTGYADFLFRVEGDSQLGDYHYEPWDTKLALKPKPYFIIQVLPKQFHIVLGNGDIKSFHTNNYYSYYQQLKSLFLLQQANFDPECMPEFEDIENYGRWSRYAEDILKKQDHLILVANIRSGQIKKLQKAGITTLTQLAQATLSHIPSMSSKTFLTLKQQASIQLKSRNKSKPKHKILDSNEKELRRGLTLLPPSSINDVWFDMEGYPFAKGGLEYLFGVAYLDSKSNLKYRDWWAHNTQQEKKALQKFVNWVYARWLKDPNMHIYHYGSYEASALKRLMGQYGVCEDRVDDLLRADVFVDLYKIVREGLLVGEPAYSLKNIERLYMGKRAATVSNATGSIVAYERWLECKDGSDWKSSEILKKIRAYNEEDCRSTRLLCDWLRNAQRAHNINYISALNGEKEDLVSYSKKLDPNNIKFKAAELAQELLDSCEKNNELPPDKKELMQLLANLLQFHRREEKPMWWAYFDRLKMTEAELIEDIDCLGGLERTKSKPSLIKQSYLYEYKYDIAQDTKLKVDSKCHAIMVTSSNPIPVTIEEMNAEEGLVYIKAAIKYQISSRKMHLIPNEHVNPDKIVQAIYDIIKEWQKTGTLPGAIRDFLLRKRPKISGNNSGGILPGKRKLLEEVVDVVSKLKNSTLCIQGPPGSGKTFTAAHVIVDLIKKGKIVGVTSNSHRAIANLIDAVMQKTDQQGIIFSAVKVQSNPEDFHVQSTLVRKEQKISLAFYKQTKLIGGTAWAFSDQSAEAKLDYLFVDEAGQVSIANLFGMSRSTKNIVLMGDQMQLSQPIRGSHSGESGMSCLNYLLQEHQTIPRDMGVFLEKTFRLNPKICQFISSTVYEDRLFPEEVTSNRWLVAPQKNMIPVDSGILFMPIKHEDNSQASEEEVEVIQKLVSDLSKFGYKDEKGNCRDLALDDILIVAPYNMQVQKIKEAIPGARVGTVDKFQGQEAAIVIFSMCASDLESSSRGLGFLLSKNRINVAISRAKILSIIVGNPNLANISCSTIEQIELVNLYCKLLEHTN